MSETKIAPETGLPELPAGHFWRVAPDDFGYAVVEIRRKTRFGSRRHSATDVSLTGAPSAPVRVRDLTPEAILESASWLLERNRDLTRGLDLLGDYPPKRLGAAS